MFLHKLAVISTRGSRCLLYLRSSASFVLLLPLASAATYTCERAKCINLSPPESWVLNNLEEFFRRAEANRNQFNITVWCLAEKPNQQSEVCLPGSPVKSSYFVILCFRTLNWGEGAIKKGLTTYWPYYSAQNWPKPPGKLSFPISAWQMPPQCFSFASGFGFLWWMLCCSCCLS